MIGCEIDKVSIIKQKKANKMNCIKCGIEKTTENTSRHPSTKDKLQRLCKACDRLNKKKWYQDSLKYARKKRKEWQENNKELHIEHVKKYMKTEKGKVSRKKYDQKRTAK